MPDIAWYIMSFCTSHSSSILLTCLSGCLRDLAIAVNRGSHHLEFLKCRSVDTHKGDVQTNIYRLYPNKSIFSFKKALATISLPVSTGLS